MKTQPRFLTFILIHQKIICRFNCRTRNLPLLKYSPLGGQLKLKENINNKTVINDAYWDKGIDIIRLGEMTEKLIVK
jgi:hypothetical protein